MANKFSLGQVSVEELMCGYRRQTDAGRFTCLVCGYESEQGRIYPEGDRFYDAEKHIQSHIARQHASPLDWLLQLDKRWTGLTELQVRLIRLFAAGATDQEIARELGSGSISTIRNHRFLLREKLKQAKIYLAIGCLTEQQAEMNAAKALPAGDSDADRETKKILAAYFPQGTDGPLSTFPTREKRRLILLRQIVTRFEPNKVYTEAEVNALLKPVYDDYLLIRRQLIDHGFLARKIGGSEYWRVLSLERNPAPPKNDEESESPMLSAEQKKELLRQYKETPRPMGVFQIKNQATGKALLLKALDIPGIINRHQLELERGLHRNKELQADWNRYGASAFSFDVLEQIKATDFLPQEWPGAVATLLEEWLEKIQPYGETGYNTKKD